MPFLISWQIDFEVDTDTKSLSTKPTQNNLKHKQNPGFVSISKLTIKLQ